MSTHLDVKGVTYHGELPLKCARQHVGEQLECDGEEQFHEGNHQEWHEWNQTQEVTGRTSQLQVSDNNQVSTGDAPADVLASSASLHVVPPSATLPRS